MMWLEAHLVDALRLGGAVAVAVGVLILLAVVARRTRRVDTGPDAGLDLAAALDQTQPLPHIRRHRGGLYVVGGGRRG